MGHLSKYSLPKNLFQFFINKAISIVLTSFFMTSMVTINSKANPIQVVFFDADDTLFHFDSYSGLKKMLSHFAIELTLDEFKSYETYNRSLWVKYQNHELTAKQVQSLRFEQWIKPTNKSGEELNNLFLEAMLEVSTPIEGALEILQFLRGKVKIGLITNGFIALQQKRLEKNGFDSFFDCVIISEQVGVAKPHPKIFNHALTEIDHHKPQEVIMIGDNLDSDIKGAKQAGFKTAWYNQNRNPLPEGVIPDFEFSHFEELKQILIDLGL